MAELGTIKTVKAYQTSDDRLHMSEELARTHEARLVAEKYMLHEAQGYMYGGRTLAQSAAISAVIGNAPAIRRTLDALDEINVVT